jgi:hypothetical protein
MRKACCAVMVWALLAGAQAAVASDGKAAIRCDDPDFNFGKKDSRENITHKFVIRNTGSGPLRISSVDATCGCTVTDVNPNVIEPGEQGEVVVTFRLAGRSGQQQKAIIVNSNARNEPNLQLVMRGTAVSHVTMKPASVFFGKVPVGKRSVESMEITTDDSVSFNVGKLKSDSPHFTPSVEVLKTGRAFRLEVALAATAPEGQLHGEIELETDSKDYPKLFVPVSAQVVGELLVMPKELVLEEGAPAATKSAFVMAGQVPKFRILEAKCSVPRVQLRVVPFGEDGYRILLRDLAAAPDLDGACLIVTTDAPTMKEVRIPFRVSKPTLAPAAGGDKDGHRP